MNVIARLEYELAYYDSAVHRFNHYTISAEREGAIIGVDMLHISDVYMTIRRGVSTWHLLKWVERLYDITKGQSRWSG